MSPAPGRARAVFDTNVYVSLFAFPGGRLDRLWELALDHRFDLFVCPLILEEFQKVAIDKLGLHEKETEFLVERILSVARMIFPSGKPVTAIPRRHPDNEILRCAISAQADFLVTGDRKHLIPLKSFRSVKLLSPAEFLEELTL